MVYCVVLTLTPSCFANVDSAVLTLQLQIVRTPSAVVEERYRSDEKLSRASAARICDNARSVIDKIVNTYIGTPRGTSTSGFS